MRFCAGIAVTYQLEEGEILGEPLPARDNRRSILAYEATEGGAGVLNRLVEKRTSLGQGRKGSSFPMHFDKVDDAIAAGDASLLVDRDSGACAGAAIAACYPISTRPRADRPRQCRGKTDADRSGSG